MDSQGLLKVTGCRADPCAHVVAVYGGESKPLPLRLDLINHSPTGFEWGYSGSGPAQLALAILACATNDDMYACALHQEFKEEFIAPIQESSWELTATEIEAWVTVHTNTAIADE